MRFCASVTVVLLLGLTLGACGGGRPTASPVTSRPSVTAGGSVTPVTGPAGVNPPDTVIHYPNPYAPSYDTLDALVSDASFIVLATVEPQESATQNYPLQIQQSFGSEARTSMSISAEELAAAHLSVGQTYVFFYAVDPVDGTDCIVGGVRGVFDYNSSTHIVTRIDQSRTSQIPSTQTLTQFGTALETAAKAVSRSSIANLPPVCRASATGLP